MTLGKGILLKEEKKHKVTTPYKSTSIESYYYKYMHGIVIAVFKNFVCHFQYRYYNAVRNAKPEYLQKIGILGRAIMSRFNSRCQTLISVCI